MFGLTRTPKFEQDTHIKATAYPLVAQHRASALAHAATACYTTFVTYGNG